MNIPNAFVGHRKMPTSGEVTAELGASLKAWNDFVGWLADEHQVASGNPIHQNLAGRYS
jgi:hypothetical protein